LLWLCIILIEGACRRGDAARRSVESLRFAGDAVITDVAGFVAAVGRAA